MRAAPVIQWSNFHTFSDSMLAQPSLYFYLEGCTFQDCTRASFPCGTPCQQRWSLVHCRLSLLRILSFQEKHFSDASFVNWCSFTAQRLAVLFV